MEQMNSLGLWDHNRTRAVIKALNYTHIKLSCYNDSILRTAAPQQIPAPAATGSHH